MKTIISTLVHSVKVSYAFHLQEEDITPLIMNRYIAIPIANLLKRLLLSPNFDINFIVKINRYCSQDFLRRLGSLKNLGSLGKSIFRLFVKQLSCSGLGDTLEEGTNEIENRACQVYLNKALFSILFVISLRIFLNPQTK